MPPAAPSACSYSATCPFCKIAAGEIPAHIVAEEKEALAFLDYRPLFPGHTLVIPRAHCETLVDAPAADIGPLFTLVQRVTGAVEVGLGADGSFVAMNNRVSQSVPHLHVHVVPRRRKDGLRGFFWPRRKYETEAEALATRDAIRNALK